VTIVRRLLDANTERRSQDWGPYGASGAIPPPSWSGAGYDDGSPVSDATALRLVDAYACMTLLADAVSMLPLDALRRTAEYREPVKGTTILDRPDPEIERWDFICRLVMSLAARGNAYAAILARDAAGWPTAMRALHPDDVAPWRDPRTGEKMWRVRGVKALVPVEDIWHIPLVTMPGSDLGLSPIECARRGIRMSVATEQFGDKWFTDGAHPSSVLESDAPVPDDEARKTVARWMASHGGRRRPALLSGGLKWRAITIAPNESQFIETRKLNTSQIARIWRVPPHMIGDVEKSTSWGSGLEEQGIGFVVFTLGPYLQRIEAAFTRIMPKPQYAKFNVGALMRGNTKDRYLSYAIGRQWGWLSVDDIRANEDLPPLPNGAGKTYLQPLNMVDAEAALKVLLDKTATPPTGGNTQ
jgi:HK97 family phage portal protein